MVGSIVNLLILNALERPMSGYEIIESIHANYGVLFSPGTIYPILKDWVGKGVLESEEMFRGKRYRLTEEGVRLKELLFDEYKGIFLFLSNKIFIKKD
ncbi:MAG: PadR family transcriptional regulator [archaeon]|nr:PadR family transcriptional regulator [archaeon]